jgi:hypothetical protein
MRSHLKFTELDHTKLDHSELDHAEPIQGLHHKIIMWREKERTTKVN